MKQIVVAAVFLAGGASAFAAEGIGRLFFTPAERAQLDQARVQKQRPVAKAEEPLAPPAAPQVLTYSGVVRRSDGKAVLWLNNRPVDEKEAMSSLSVSGAVRSDGAVVVRVPQSGKTIDLKVGQSVELGSGAIAERQRPAPAPTAVKPSAASEAPPPSAAPAEPPADRSKEAAAAPRPEDAKSR